MSDEPLNVVLLWHMHQPNYYNALTEEYKLPWTYLHAIKDYTDMAAHLEKYPQARAVVNFVPILLEQLDDYARNIDYHLHTKSVLRDPMLQALVSETYSNDPSIRLQIIKASLRANKKHLIAPYPAFQQLADHAEWLILNPRSVIDVSDQFIADLLVWYHLAWMGESVRQTYDVLPQLMDKGRGFSLQERVLLLQCIGEVIGTIIPRYRSLSEQGRIELSFTPYSHPILPLLIDFQSSEEALPNISRPHTELYPGGMMRAHWHVEQGINIFKKYFGSPPTGCWPAEGGVSDSLIHILSEHPIQWIATGEAVLHNSLNSTKLHEQNPAFCLHRSYQLDNLPIRCFFRDDGLSDLIGFQYADWHADDAIANLIHHLENINTACQDTAGRIVPIILDGENAWEYYPRNGYFFLNALYRELSSHPRIRLTTFSDFIKTSVDVYHLPHIVAGSWVYGTFSTWIGHQDKNRAWDLLCEAKQTVDTLIKQNQIPGEKIPDIIRQLAICEGSDWFWWFGDYNPEQTVSDFEQLFRLNLQTLYKMLEQPIPDKLFEPISHGQGTPVHGGVMRQSHPT